MEHSHSPMEISNNFNINDIFDYDKNFENISKYVFGYIPPCTHYGTPSIIKNLNTIPCLSNLQNLFNKYNIKIYIGSLNTLLASIPVFYPSNGQRYIFYTDHNIVITISNLIPANGSSSVISIKSIER